MPGHALVGAVAALVFTFAGCTATDPEGTSFPAATSTVQVNAPASVTPPLGPSGSTAPSAQDIEGDGHEHGLVDLDATNEPTNAGYLTVKQVSEEFVGAFYDFGYPDGYARDYLDRSQPYMTERFFYEQLNLVEDSGANSDPAWQQLTREQRRSIVEVGTVIPGYVQGSKAVSRVEVRVAIVATDSDGRTEGVPDAATPQHALLTFAKVKGEWLVDNSELAQT